MVAAYQLPRRQKDLGTGKPKIQETSLPSLGFYLDKNFIQAERHDQMIPRIPLWIFTRSERITGLDQVKLSRVGYRLERVQIPTPTQFFEVWRLEQR